LLPRNPDSNGITIRPRLHNNIRVKTHTSEVLSCHLKLTSQLRQSTPSLCLVVCSQVSSKKQIE
jgi:hypothetical protein